MKLNVLRYFLIRDPGSCLSSSNIFCEDKIFDVFYDKTRVTYYNKLYFTMMINEKTDDILIGFLLKSRDTDIIIPEEDELEKHIIPNWTPCFLAIDKINQTILIQNISGSFTPILVKNVLNQLFAKKAKDYDVLVQVEFVCKPEKFWETYYRASKRYKISISLNAPNLFAAKKSTNEYLKAVRDNTNMDKFTQTLENEQGNLDVKPEYIEDALEYANQGGGHWSQKTEEKGSIITTKSNSAVVQEPTDLNIDTSKTLKDQFDYVKKKIIGIFAKHAIDREAPSKDNPYND